MADYTLEGESGVIGSDFAKPDEDPTQVEGKPQAEQPFVVDPETSRHLPAQTVYPEYAPMDRPTRKRFGDAIMAALEKQTRFEEGDAYGRKWLIEPETLSNHAVVAIRLSRGADYAPVFFVSSGILGTERGRKVAKDAIISVDGSLT